MKQKVLFFDIDGTLIWSYGGIQEIPQGVQKELKRYKDINSLFVVDVLKPC